MIQQYILAPRKSTQQEMDETVRLRNKALMPFAISDSMRILAFLIWWTSIFQGVAVWGVIYFLIQNFVSRSNLMGRVETGPPTKALQYRICFHVYLPFHLVLRTILSLQEYAAVPLASPYSHPLGDGNEWTYSWRHSGPQGFHFFGSLLILVVILIIMPLHTRLIATKLGVLTPWAMLKMACFVGHALDDEGFATSARVAVGGHHTTSREHFGGEEEGEVGKGEKEDVQLPADLKEGAMYQPPVFIDLLSAGIPRKATGLGCV